MVQGIFFFDPGRIRRGRLKSNLNGLGFLYWGFFSRYPNMFTLLRQPRFI